MFLFLHALTHSFAMTLYELLTGIHPYSGESLLPVLIALLIQDSSILPLSHMLHPQAYCIALLRFGSFFVYLTDTKSATR